MESIQTATTASFPTWLFRTRQNKHLLYFAGIIIVVHFAWIKILYPYPNFMPPDSYSYIDAAERNLIVSIWPTGYSWFLRLVSIFSKSHFFLVTLQYLLLQASLLYLLFTFKYFLEPGKRTFLVMLMLSIANPLIGHLSNFISSDAIFTTISLIWFAQLLWLLFRPTNRLLWIHALVILLAVMVRHNALYYPFISAGVIVFSSLPRRLKWHGLARITVLLLWFIGYSQYYNYETSGKAQYSAFAGWQMASNALYGYAYAEPDSPWLLPAQFVDLHVMVNRHMNSLRDKKIRPDAEVGIYYLWDEQSPLKEYMRQTWQGDTTANNFKRWASMGKLYGKYGRELILRYPGAFLKHYIWPNLINYYIPPAQFMGWYNLGRPEAEPPAAKWFGWKNRDLPTRTNSVRIEYIEYFSVLMALINVAYLAAFVGFVFVVGCMRSFYYGNGFAWWLTMVWLANMVFSVFSAPIEMRYQVFPTLFTLISTIGIIAHMTTFAKVSERFLPQKNTASGDAAII